MVDGVTLKDDFTFLVSDQSGDVRNNAEGHGMYLHDTRYLSRYELLVDGEQPPLLSSTTDYNIGATFRMSAAHFGPVNRGGEDTEGRIGHMIGIARRRYIEHGLVESIEFTNYYPAHVDVKVTLLVGADFLDMFEMRGMPRSAPGHTVEIEVQAEHPSDGTSLLFRTHPIGAHAASKPRTMLFLCDVAPASWEKVSETSAVTGLPTEAIALHYTLQLPPRQAVELNVRATPEPGETGAKSTQDSHNGQAKTSFRQQVGLARRVFTDWQQSCTRIETGSYTLNRILETSILDLRSLMQQEPQGLVVTAGLPWYFTLFGRDSIITAYEILMLNPQIAVDTLRALAAYQATEVDDWRDSEPGKILHELRRGDMAMSNEVPHSPYYGSVDSTLLYMMLFAETLKWTNSQGLFDELWGSVERALGWAWHYGDMDGDGYIEFSARSTRGIRHQGWKDSDESLGGTVGPRPKPPIALVEVQGYYYAALTGVAGALRRYGKALDKHEELAGKLEAQAAKLKEQFNRDFWWEEEGFFVHALDGSKAQVRDVASNVGHCLWTGIVDEDRAGRVVSRLVQPDMLSGWGVRTISAEDKTYNPMSYHNGSIWPHDNAILVAGLRRYGFDREMLQVAGEILDAAATFPAYRLPELYCGFSRGEGIEQESAPAAYPVSCSPQAWAAGTPLMMLQALLGLQIDDTQRVSATPLLPDGIEKIELRGMHVGTALLDLDFAADSNQEAPESGDGLILAGQNS